MCADLVSKPCCCRIKMLPEEHWAGAAGLAATINPANAVSTDLLRFAAPNLDLSIGSVERQRLAIVTSKYWGAGGVKLTVGFLDNPEELLKKRILGHMNAWGKYANVEFVETSDSPQVRISRTPGDGYWSYLGTDIGLVDSTQATMNLDSFSMKTDDSEFYRVVRHETGHTLGFPHEHMRSQMVSGIDREKAIAFFAQKYGWEAQTVISQVLTPLDDSTITSGGEADPNSIMCYWLPGSIMKDGKDVVGGRDINEADGQFARKLYPKP
jgi:hypothetical protein